VYRQLLLQMAKVVSHRIEVSILFKSKFTSLGALLLEKQLRSFVQFFGEMMEATPNEESGRDIEGFQVDQTELKKQFWRMQQLVLVLSVFEAREAKDYYEPPMEQERNRGPGLSKEDIKKALKRRVDLEEREIDRIQFE